MSRSKLLISLFLFSLSHFAFGITAPLLNLKLRNINAQWRATHKSVEPKFTGLKDAPLGIGLFEEMNTAPEKWDWREQNTINWIGPVMDQGSCGSCVAFAAIATLEAQYKISSGLSWLDPHFSPQQLFNCGGGSCDGGWQLAGAARSLKKNGVVDAACVPYQSGVTGRDWQCSSNTCADQSKRITKINDYRSPSMWGGSMANVKAALKKGPLMTSMIVYEDFLYYGNGIYKSISQKAVGGHAISLVGFNDIERYWIIRNSWGKNWGEGGFARISYDDKSGIGETTFAFDLIKFNQALVISNPENREYISGEKSFVLTSTEPMPTVIVVRGEGEYLKLDACDESGSKLCQINFDTRTVRDGHYEVFAQNTQLQSQIKEFFVVNHPPSIALTFKAAPGIDLSKPQKDRIDFLISTTSSSVLPARVHLMVANEKGEIVLTRTTENVVREMRLGFKTNSLPNGKYNLYFESEIPVAGKIHTSRSNLEKIIIGN